MYTCKCFKCGSVYEGEKRSNICWTCQRRTPLTQKQMDELLKDNVARKPDHADYGAPAFDETK